MKITLIVSAIASLTLITNSLAQAQSPAATPPDTIVTAPEATVPPPAKMPKVKAEKGTTTKARANASYPFRGRLKALDKDALTFTIAGKDKDRVFRITSQTRFTKDGKPATLSDAVLDGEIAGSARKAAEGKEEAVSVRFGPATKAGQPAGKGKSKPTATPAKVETP